jgi:hypothetical protein
MNAIIAQLHMSGRHLLDITHTNRFGETVHPVLEAKRAQGGQMMFTISRTGRSTDTEGISLAGLLGLLADGSFARGAKVRMSPLSPSAEGKSSAFPVGLASLSPTLVAWLGQAPVQAKP